MLTVIFVLAAVLLFMVGFLFYVERSSGDSWVHEDWVGGAFFTTGILSTIALFVLSLVQLCIS